MRLASLILLSLLFSLVFADSIDNEMIESLRKSKEESKQEKQLEIKENEQQEKNEINHNKKVKSKIDTDKSPFRKKSALTQDYDEDKHEKEYEKISLFIGGIIGTQVNAKYNNAKASMFNVALNIGLLYKINYANGFRLFVTSSYNSIDNDNFFGTGGGIDYLYSFRSFKLALFGGILADMPISTKLLNQPNVLVSAGLIGYLDKKTSLELRIGYPVFKDERLDETLSVNVALSYIFYTK